MKIVFHQPWGGLGDNLQFSTLPELLTKQGHEFYIHETNLCRNQGINDLVWKMNPYVKGVVTGSPNAGSSRDSIMRSYSSEIPFIKRIELAHGIDSDREGYYPFLYYTPNFIQGFEECTVVNLSSYSLGMEQYIINGIEEKLNELTKEETNVISLSFDDIPSSQRTQHIYGAGKLNVKDIFHHCDIIHSCKRYISVFSGSSVLASAIKGTTGNQIIDIFIPPLGFDTNNFFIFENTNYHYL